MEVQPQASLLFKKNGKINLSLSGHSSRSTGLWSPGEVSAPGAYLLALQVPCGQAGTGHPPPLSLSTRTWVCGCISANSFTPQGFVLGAGLGESTRVTKAGQILPVEPMV